jgi:hypothetical protein
MLLGGYAVVNSHEPGFFAPVQGVASSASAAARMMRATTRPLTLAPMHGSESTREATMAVFAKSGRRE